jgi:hypothetical protein
MLLDTIFDKANQAHIEPRHRVTYIEEALVHKGFGDNHQELKFISLFLQKVFSTYHQLESFTWSQYQDYNDNYLEFNLENFYVNKIYEMEAYGFNSWDTDEEWMYFFDCQEKFNSMIGENENCTDEYWDNLRKYHSELQVELAPVKKATDCILVFFKALLEYYKPYYFIYVFGRRATVVVTKQGITIDNINIDYIDGDSWDKSFII